MNNLKTTMIIYAIILIAGAFGWVNNIIKIFGINELTGEIFIRIAGAFLVPLGAVLGYF